MMTGFARSRASPSCTSPISLSLLAPSSFHSNHTEGMCAPHLLPPALSFLPPPCPHYGRLVLLLVMLLAPLFAPVVRGQEPEYRELHNVWYNGLFISGIAVDESTGDVFFSDAAANRVVRQSANGTVLAVYRDDFYSPMQLAYYDGTLYVADSTNNRVGWVDLPGSEVQWVMSSFALRSSTALTLHPPSNTLWVLDGWGLAVQPYNVSGSQQWGRPVALFGFQVDPPLYLSSISVLPQQLQSDPVLLVDPLTRRMFNVSNWEAEPIFNLSNTTSVRAIAQLGGASHDEQNTIFVLSQPAADQPMTVTLLDESGQFIRDWQAHGRGGKAVPFYGWAMHVDSSANMYISDHAVNTSNSPYGRVVKLAPNGTELGEWSMSDRVAYSFTSIVFYSADLSGEPCALWMTELDRGVMRITADGTVLLVVYAPPRDPSDNRTAVFSGSSIDYGTQSDVYNDSSLVLLDTSSPLTTKLWSFSLVDYTYSLINTTAAQLGPNISGVAVDPEGMLIYVSDTTRRTVVCLKLTGEFHYSWNASQQGFVEPAGMLLVGFNFISLFVTDLAYNGTGAVFMLDCSNPTSPPMLLPQSTPPMYRPLSVATDSSFRQLFVSDSNGRVFQYDLTPQSDQRSVFRDTPVQRNFHQPVPDATNIVSMQLSDSGDVYMLDRYSHRMIIKVSTAPLMGRWQPAQYCLPPKPAVRHSSSSSSSTAVSPLPSSSSSGRAVQTEVGFVWSVDAVLAVGVSAILAVVAGSSCLYITRSNSHRGGDSTSRGQLNEQLLAEQQDEQYGEDEVEDEAVWSFEQVLGESDGESADSVLLQAAVTLGATVDLTLHSADSLQRLSQAGRYDYYVARYEVTAIISEVEVGLWLPELHRSVRPALSNAAKVRSTTFTTSTASTSDDASSLTNSSTLPPATAQLPSHPVTLSFPDNPRHIARLDSVLQSMPHFIDSVSDLTILGEGSSGLVYSGTYNGIACVVKLPKAAVLAGAAWREWQCHLRLPPDRSVVRFLGALPMSSTNYLVTGFVRQGSLHSLLQSVCGVWYSRPYGLMRCVRDMCRAARHCHSHRIVHRDVSCRNILVDSDGRAVLADLGLAVQVTAVDDSTQSVLQATTDSDQTAVPVRWTSPEALAHSHYSSRSDVWSLGVAVWEMTARGRLPYSEQPDTRQCIRAIRDRQLTLQVDEQWGRDDSMSGAERQLADIVRRVVQLCLTYDYEQRPDSEQLLDTTERWWEEWREEWSGEVEELDRQWEEYHKEVQHRLGRPVEV